MSSVSKSAGAVPVHKSKAKAAQTISRETGAPIYTLAPVVTGPETDVPLTYYEDRMRENMQTLLVALTPAEGE